MKIELKTSRWFLLLHLPSSGRLQFGDYKCSRWGRWLIPVPAVCRLCVQRARRRGCESAGASLCARYVRILVFRKQKHLCAYVRLEQRQTSRWVTRWYVCIFKFKEPPLGVQVKETGECLLDSHVSTCNVTCSILGGRPHPTFEWSIDGEKLEPINSLISPERLEDSSSSFFSPSRSIITKAGHRRFLVPSSSTKMIGSGWPWEAILTAEAVELPSVVAARER